MTKKKDVMVRKNIDLPKWVVDEFGLEAKKHNNKWKPFLEFKLSRMASEYKEMRLNPHKTV